MVVRKNDGERYKSLKTQTRRILETKHGQIKNTIYATSGTGRGYPQR
jgi:hypothetical protein